MPSPTHEYELTEAADGDVLAIARYTVKKWGIDQARHYEKALERRSEKEKFGRAYF